MARVLIVYGSETGNTKTAAEMIRDVLARRGHEVEVRDVVDTTADELLKPFDLYLLGVSTWGAVEDEVQEDFKAFYAEMADANLTDKPFGVFGAGDKGYANFCKAVDYVAQRVEEQGGSLVLDKLKINLDPNTSREMVEDWAAGAADFLKKDI